jgi:hypothetical protein
LVRADDSNLRPVPSPARSCEIILTAGRGSASAIDPHRYADPGALLPEASSKCIISEKKYQVMFANAVASPRNWATCGTCDVLPLSAPELLFLPAPAERVAPARARRKA